MTQTEALKLALEALENNKQKHHYCEDTWYSCPKHEDGCANEAEGDECNCGADEINAQFDKAITAIKEALREHAMYEVQRLGQEIQPEQEPVGINGLTESETNATASVIGLVNTTPPQRTWVGLTPQERDEINQQVFGIVPHYVAFHHAIEAKLKEKNT